MIVRILNNKRDRDSLYDCRNSCIRKTKQGDAEEFLLILEFMSSNDAIEVVLASDDEIYYMNGNGETIHADYRMLNR